MRSLGECKKNKNTAAGNQFLLKGEYFSSYIATFLRLPSQILVDVFCEMFFSEYFSIPRLFTRQNSIFLDH